MHKNISMYIVMALTLGLAPFYPEPHIWGKLKWLAGGAVGMQPMDWFDLLLHGFPWILLMVATVQFIVQKRKEPQNAK